MVAQERERGMRTAIGSAAEDKPHDWLFFNMQVRLNKKKKEEKNVIKKKS